MEAPTRGPLGGMYVRGTATTGVVGASITTAPSTDEDPKIRLSVTLIDPGGKPIRQLLPWTALRRAIRSSEPPRLRPGVWPADAAHSLPLPEPPPALRSQVLLYAEALGTISQYASATITLPELPVLTADDFATVVATAGMLRAVRIG